MALHGNLRDMGVADLIQHTCQDGKTARVTIEHDHQRVQLFFEAGRLFDAELAGEHGEEVIYDILEWSDGAFVVEPNIRARIRSITRSSAALLLTGAQRLDESNAQATELEVANLIMRKETTTMAPKKKSELLADALDELIASSSDIEGAAVVGTDGLVYSINTPTGKVDETLVGAVAAAAMGLSQRSVEQLKRGSFMQSLIQGDKGNIIITPLDQHTLFVELTPSNVNLGMAFAETREAAGKIREIL